LPGGDIQGSALGFPSCAGRMGKGGTMVWASLGGLQWEFVIDKQHDGIGCWNQSCQATIGEQSSGSMPHLMVYIGVSFVSNDNKQGWKASVEALLGICSIWVFHECIGAVVPPALPDF